MILDIFVLIVLLISAGIAFMRGFIREVLTIAGIAGGAFAAYLGGPVFAPVVQGWLGVQDGVDPERLFGVVPYDVLGSVLAYGGIFIVVVIVLSIASHFLAEGARKLGLGAVDRTFGFLFGVVRGVIVIGLLYLPVHLFVGAESKAEWFGTSKTHFYVDRVSGFFASFFSENAKEAGDAALDQANDMMTTREKLQDINLLQGDGMQDVQDKIQDLGEQIDPVKLEGYSEDFREGMDALIEQNARPLNE